MPPITAGQLHFFYRGNRARYHNFTKLGLHGVVLSPRHRVIGTRPASPSGSVLRTSPGQVGHAGTWLAWA